MLTEKDKIFIKRYSRLKYSYIFFLPLICIIAILLYYFAIDKLIPNYLIPLEKYPKAKEFVELAMWSMLKISFFWLALLLGMFFGELYCYLKITSIFKKIKENT